MKNQFLPKTSLARLSAVFILALLSCDPESIDFSATEKKISISQDVSVINGVVSFRSTQSYTDLIENQDGTLKKKFSAKVR